MIQCMDNPQTVYIALAMVSLEEGLLRGTFTERDECENLERETQTRRSPRNSQRHTSSFIVHTLVTSLLPPPTCAWKGYRNFRGGHSTYLMTKEQAHLIRKMRATQIAHSMMTEIISIVVAKVCLFFGVLYIYISSCVPHLYTEFSPRLGRLIHPLCIYRLLSSFSAPTSSS